MKVLLIGSGGREHALAWKLAQSPKLTQLYAAPGSAAIAETAECVGLKVSRHAAVIEFCRERSIALVVIGPEAPLAAGLADALGDAGIPAFGPRRKAARLESSKAFAKDFMRRHGVPTAASETFSDSARAKSALRNFAFPMVIKADGLAAGKGVSICANAAQAETALDEYMSGRALGGAGRTVVLEEFLEGREVSHMGLCDGETFLALPPSSDHKRLLDDDQGPNTGGMGVIAPTPAATADILQAADMEVINRVLAGMRADGMPFCGVLYCGLMLTAAGVKVLEFNVRFGDPETQAVLPLLRGDLLELIEAAVRGDLSGKRVAARGAGATIILASEGYPSRPLTGRTITGVNAAGDDDSVVIFHAGTTRENGVWKTKGGRVLGVTGLGANLDEARSRAYYAAKRIHFEGMQYRRDIGLSHMSAAALRQG